MVPGGSSSGGGGGAGGGGSRRWSGVSSAVSVAVALAG